jgi:hypothetical protein
MKRFIIILSALAAAGCTMNRQNLYDPEVGMSFQPAMLMHVAEDDAERYPADQSFGVSAWSLPDEKQWNGNSADATLYIDALEAKPIDELNWCCDEKLVWPSVLENLTFMSWSPYSAGQQCDNEDGVRFEINDILTEQTDILYTDPLQDICKIECGGVVTIPFRHALCQMSICVKNRVFETEKIIVKDVVMDRIAGSGTFSSLKDPQWQTDEDKVSVTFLDEPFQTGAHPEPAGRKWLLIPQEINTPLTVEFSFTVETGETITQRLKTIPLKMRLEAGKSYIMTLSIGIDDVKFLEEIIKDRFEK